MPELPSCLDRHVGNRPITCRGPGPGYLVSRLQMGLYANSTSGTCCLASFLGLCVGSCQNYGPFFGSLYNMDLMFRVPKKGTIILTTIHVGVFDLLVSAELPKAKQDPSMTQPSIPVSYSSASPIP